MVQNQQTVQCNVQIFNCLKKKLTRSDKIIVQNYTSKNCSIAKYYTHTKDHCLNCLFNDPILNWSVPFKLKPLFTKSDID